LDENGEMGRVSRKRVKSQDFERFIPTDPEKGKINPNRSTQHYYLHQKCSKYKKTKIKNVGKIVFIEGVDRCGGLA